MKNYGGPRKLLILSVALLIAGFMGSAIYWSASRDAAFLATQENYENAILAAAAREDSAVPRADAQWNRVNQAARLVEAHGHLLFLCIFLILFAILLADSTGAGKASRHMVKLATGGVLIYPTGLVAQGAGFIEFGQVLSAVGAVLILLFTGRIVAGLFKSRPVTQPPGNDQTT